MNGGGPPPPASLSNKNNGSPPRLYQVWKGRNRFFFGGRLIVGPDFKSIYLTTSLILAPVVLFCAFVARDLINEFPHHFGVLLIVFTVVSTIYYKIAEAPLCNAFCGILAGRVIVLLLITSTTDPGIIPRNTCPPEPDDDDSSISDWAGSHVGGYFLPPTKEVTVNGMTLKIKYCQTCMLYRPPRCSHCSVCDNCVDRFDHHCPWVGQCIGKRNYRFFFMFVSTTTILCLFMLAFCCVNINRVTKEYNCSMWNALMKTPASGLLIIYTFIGSWFVGGLTVFHFYLISTNQTTYENFRYQYDTKRNPHNIGCARNFQEIFWSKLPRSSSNFRAKVKVELCSNSIGSQSSGPSSSPEVSKANHDLEIGRREAVDAQEFYDITSQFPNSNRLDVL